MEVKCDMPHLFKYIHDITLLEVTWYWWSCCFSSSLRSPHRHPHHVRIYLVAWMHPISGWAFLGTFAYNLTLVEESCLGMNTEQGTIG